MFLTSHNGSGLIPAKFRHSIRVSLRVIMQSVTSVEGMEIKEVLDKIGIRTPQAADRAGMIPDNKIIPARMNTNRKN